MSVIFTGTNQGVFTSTGQPQIIQIPSGVDWMWVKNLTVSYAAGAGAGAEFYWQLGMAQGLGTVYIKTVGTNALSVEQVTPNEGFYLINSTINIPTALTAITGINAAGGAFGGPQVLTGDTGSIPVTDVVGDNVPAAVIRLVKGTGNLANQLNGLDFSVANVVLDTSMDLIYMPAIVDATASPGYYRVIPFDPYYYPTIRYITAVTQTSDGTATIITLSVTHGYQVGQEVRLIVPEVTSTTYGMTELNGLQVAIISVGDADADGTTNTITVNVDSTGFTAFAFPLTASPGFTPAQVVPIGENTAIALNLNQNILSDATVNTGYFGIQLQAGALSPAGVSGNSIYWVAGKSFNT